LVLFTEHFPYLPGEQFLEDEIVYLARSFENVLIVPRRTAGAARPLPKNVRVDLSLNEAARPWLGLGMNSAVMREIQSNWRSLLQPRGLKRFAEFLWTAERVARWISTSGLDPESTVWYSYWLGHSAAGVALAQTRDPKLRPVARAHGWDVYESRHVPAYLPFRSLIFAAVEPIFSVSEDGREHLLRTSKRASHQVQVARLGVEPAGSLNRASEDGILRLVSCSTLVPVKRLDRLIEGLAVLGRLRPDLYVEWTHLGDGPLRGELEAAAQRLPKQIHWRFAGMLARQEILRYYREEPVDLFVNTSESEGVPVSIMEAQAHGIPVAATAVGGVPEIVGHSSGFLLNASFSAEELVRVLVETAQPSDATEKRRYASLTSWRERWDATQNYQDFARALQKMAQGTEE
jgi:glycosyltransferase involved in cell wall biosynthesis